MKGGNYYCLEKGRTAGGGRGMMYGDCVIWPLRVLCLEIGDLL